MRKFDIITSLQIQKQPLYLVIAAFAAIYILWGATYLFNKIAVGELPPMALAGLRFTIASILIFFLFVFGKKRKLPVKKELANTAFAGFLFLTIGNGGVVWALQYVDSGFTALVISAQPLVTLLLMRMIDKKTIRPKSLLGVFLGMIGIALLVSQQELVHTDQQWMGLGMILICLLTWGYGSIWVSKAQLPTNQFINAGFQMFFGGILLLIASLILGESVPDLTSLSSEIYYAMAFLIIAGSIMAYTSFNYLLSFISPEKVATSTYVNPVVALILGWWVLSEMISIQSIVATVILFSGVYFVNSSKQR